MKSSLDVIVLLYSVYLALDFITRRELYLESYFVFNLNNYQSFYSVAWLLNSCESTLHSYLPKARDDFNALFKSKKMFKRRIFSLFFTFLLRFTFVIVLLYAGILRQSYCRKNWPINMCIMSRKMFDLKAFPSCSLDLLFNFDLFIIAKKFCSRFLYHRYSL